MMKNYLKTLGAILMLSSAVPTLGEAKDPINFEIEQSLENYNCLIIPGGANLCIQKTFGSVENTELIRSAFTRALASFALDKTSKACINAVDGSEPIVEELNETLLPKNGKDPVDLKIFVSSFGESENTFDTLHFFAFKDYYHSLFARGKTHFLVGLNIKRLKLRELGLGASVRFWSSMATLAILENLGFSEDPLDLDQSVPAQIAACVHFGGNIPEGFQNLPSFSTGGGQ